MKKRHRSKTRQKPDPEDGDAARDHAIRLLARREYARGELAMRLRQRGFSPDCAESVLDGLEERGYLSDERFAEIFVRTRIERGSGPLKIRAELGQRGVADEIIDRALAEADCDFGALAHRVRCRRFGETPPADFEDKARQARFLAQRGFRADDVRRSLDADPSELGIE